MIDRFNEHELLAWIEGDLPEAKARKLEARLASDPEVRTLVESMRADRAALRTLPEPELPGDFVAALEPQLVRTMLMDDPITTMPVAPGAYRRTHQRRGARRLTMFAVAAMILIAASAAVWATVVLLPALDAGNRGAPDATVALAPAPPVAAPRDDAPASFIDLAPDAPLPPDTVVHHRAPMPRAPMPRLVTDVERTPSVMESPASPAVVDLDFALVIRATDTEAVETLLARLLNDPDARDRAPVAFVRNFSFAEATRLVMAQRPDSTPTELMSSAGTGTGDGAQVAVRRQAILDGLRAPEQPQSASARLVGPRELAPSFERQLELSDLGATHTIVIPERRLAGLLSRLRLEEGQDTTLRPLGKPLPSSDTAALERWMNDYRIVSTFVGGLRTASGLDQSQRRVVLPVVIEVVDGER